MKQLVTHLLLVLFFVLPIHAISFHHIGSYEGMSHPTVLSIGQDDIGRIWLGTREGLNIYNGHDMKVLIGEITVPNGKRMNIGSHISLIKSDHRGNMFVIAEGNLFQCNLEKNLYEQLTHKHSTHTLTIKGDSIWYIDDHQLKVYRPSLRTRQTVKEIPFTKVRSLELLDNKLFIGTLKGLHILSMDNPTITTELEKEHIFKLFRNSKDEIWIGTAKNDIYKYLHDQIVKLPYLPNTNPYFPSNPIRDFIEDSEGNIWVGTSEGLFKYNYAKDTFYAVNPPQYLGGFSVLCISNRRLKRASV